MGNGFTLEDLGRIVVGKGNYHNEAIQTYITPGKHYKVTALSLDTNSVSVINDDSCEDWYLMKNFDLLHKLRLAKLESIL